MLRKSNIRKPPHLCHIKAYAKDGNDLLVALHAGNLFADAPGVHIVHNSAEEHSPPDTCTMFFHLSVYSMVSHTLFHCSFFAEE
jgi:hypothetical protein